MAFGDVAPKLSPRTRKGSKNSIAIYAATGTILSGLTGSANQAVYFNSSGVPTAGTLPVGAMSSSVVTSSGNLSPLFTTSIAAQALSFTLSNAAAGALFGNWSNSSGAPSYVAGTATGQVPTRQSDGSVAWVAPSGSGTVNTGTAGQLAYYATSTNAVSGDANATVSSGALTLGQSGVAGSVVLNGATSGTATIQATAVAGTVTCTLPAANSNPVQPLGSGTAHQWVQYIDSSGVQHTTQPAFTDVSGTATVAQGGTNSGSQTGNSVMVTNSGGTTIQSLTGSANQAVYFNSSSVPSAGILPMAAGGNGTAAPFEMGFYTYFGGV